MHIVYHCATGCHSSSTAAAMHLDLLPIDTKPSYHDLINVPFYDELEETDRGRLILRGTDIKGNKIYTLSRKYIPHLVLPVVCDTWKAFNQSEKDLMLINTQPGVNGFMKFGGYLSRRLKLTKVGKPIVAKATLYSYNYIANIVKDTKDLLS
ncbi:DUF3189 family protein [Wukongibacter sp. M2B1]|uniref:DUF3189 family protein n=1 Tax=Wukongibacter sp. M2B1 TaxID=3088895 RepID=UPI003D7A7709